MIWPAVSSFDALFLSAATRWAGGTGLDPASFAALLKAHAAVESNLKPGAFRREPGHRASRGLMQILDTTAQALGMGGSLGNDSTRSGGLYDPAVAIPLAAQLVAQNLQSTGGNINAAIAAYNEGITRAQEDAAGETAWRTSDPAYVSKVQAAFTQYAPDFQAGPVVADDPTTVASVSPAVLASLLGLGIAFLVWWGRR